MKYSLRDSYHSLNNIFFNHILKIMFFNKDNHSYNKIKLANKCKNIKNSRNRFLKIKINTDCKIFFLQKIN